ncbi:MAG: ParB/Srx family N-terminal domain-containing protein [Vibrio splendidus]
MAISAEEKKWLKKVKYKPTYSPSDIRMPNNIPLIKVSELVPYANNVKIHSHEQVARICASIDADGCWTTPVVVDDDNEIIAGHGRRLAAIHYGLDEVPCIKLVGISKEKANQIRIADNKVAEGEIDTNLLEFELQMLSDFGIDMIGIFDERELNFLLDDLGELNLDELAGDIPSEVSQKSEETQLALERHEEGVTSLRDVFGTATVSTSQARILKLFMAHIQGSSDIDGISALVDHASVVLGVE